MSDQRGKKQGRARLVQLPKAAVPGAMLLLQDSLSVIDLSSSSQRKSEDPEMKKCVRGEIMIRPSEVG